jgi:hypothetical protein
MTTKRRRVDLEDDPDPPFVSEREKPIPHCCRCGREVPRAKTLWTLCAECVNRELEITPGTFPLTSQEGHHTSTGAVIGQLARELALKLASRAGDHTPLPPAAVLHHEARFLTRGLDQGTARRLAEALATDPSHRAGCAICQGDLAAIVAQLEKPSQETERLERIGRDHLPRRGRRS